MSVTWKTSTPLTIISWYFSVAHFTKLHLYVFHIPKHKWTTVLSLSLKLCRKQNELRTKITIIQSFIIMKALPVIENLFFLGLIYCLVIFCCTLEDPLQNFFQGKFCEEKLLSLHVYVCLRISKFLICMYMYVREYLNFSSLLKKGQFH